MTANTSTERSAISGAAEDPLHQFTAAFGEHGVVLQEIHEYWHNGGSPFPIEICEHLLQARLKDGRIDEKVANQLHDYFKESFNPDSVTGYHCKHREPLIEALAEEYLKEKNLKPLLLIEGDFINLSGLNAALGKASADAVIRYITDTITRHLDKQYNLSAIRHGGDEIRLWVQPKKVSGLSDVEDDVRAVIADIQAEIAEFVKQYGLNTTKHNKRDDKGAGIGLAVVSCRDKKTKVEIRSELERGIEDNKEWFYRQIQNGEPQLEKDKLKGFLSDDKHFNSKNPATHLLENGLNFSGDTPEDARYLRLQRLLVEKKGRHDLNCDETRALKGIHQLTAKNDPVNGLPLVLDAADLEETILPYFQLHHGKKFTLVHFDFSNMGGGNTIGTWVADAMSRVFRECIAEGMSDEDLNLSKYLPYLTSSGGGKFDLILPATISPEVLTSLHNKIEKKFIEKSNKELDITSKEVDATFAIAARLNAKRRKAAEEEKQLPTNEMHRRQPMPEIRFKNANAVTINDILNNKTHFNAGKGSNMVLTAMLAHDVTSLKLAMAKTKEKAEHAQDASNQVMRARLEARQVLVCYRHSGENDKILPPPTYSEFKPKIKKVRVEKGPHSKLVIDKAKDNTTPTL